MDNQTQPYRTSRTEYQIELAHKKLSYLAGMDNRHLLDFFKLAQDHSKIPDNHNLYAIPNHSFLWNLYEQLQFLQYSKTLFEITAAEFTILEFLRISHNLEEIPKMQNPTMSALNKAGQSKP